MSYTGRATRTGNSKGFRFESALFTSHPEFASGDGLRLTTKRAPSSSTAIACWCGRSGDAYKRWRRDKFFRRFRLFFRYSTDADLIAYVWLSDETTLRQSGPRTDSYLVYAVSPSLNRPLYVVGGN